MNLKKEIEKIKKSPIKKIVDKRLKEFSSFKNKSEEEWFSELCYCILTANSKAETALAIQKELGEKFLTKTPAQIKKVIQKNKHRFHNNKTKYIIEARNNKFIKNKLKKEIQTIIKKDTYENEKKAREFLVKNIKGIGYKEASHFLRNVGYKYLSILDRHIINTLLENKIIKEKPKSLTKKNYLEIEQKFIKLAKKLNITPLKLDLYLWFMKTGHILK